MRTPLSAFQAFLEDSRSSSALQHAGEHRLEEWLAIAKTAEALSTMGKRGREEYLALFDDALLPPRGKRPTLTHDTEPPPSDQLGELTERFRVAAEDMEQAGCYNLAFTTVAAACRLAAKNGYVLRMMATTQLGRIARQMDDVRTAADCYKTLVRVGLHKRDGPIAGRGYLGLGLLALRRGNGPLVRTFFERALAVSPPGGNIEQSARMGLMNVATRQSRFADALLHGWRAHDLSIEGSAQRLSILSNLSLVALRAGFPRAAMNGFRHALSTSNDFPRVVLGVCGDAVRAAAELNDQAVVRELASQGDQACERLNERFETATFDLAVGEAWTLLGNRVAARARLARVRKAAKRYHYHELLLKAEATLDILESEQTVAPSPELRTDAWKDRSEDMLSGIHRLEILGVGA